MDWNERMGIEWLRRIVVLLFSLADCAEKTAGRSWLARRHVLAILRRAEASAFRCIANAARDFGMPHPASAICAAADWMHSDHGNSADAALMLAQRLRALAIALAHLLSLVETGAASQTHSIATKTANAPNVFSLCQAALALSATCGRAAIRAPPCQAASQA